MQQSQESVARKLADQNLISEAQYSAVKEYHSFGIFSIHTELLSLLYLSILFMTGGAGILIYQHIDTIGHSIILTLLFIVTVACFYNSFKKSKGFSRYETVFESPVYDYLVLFATLLSCLFIGYLQFQYQVFGVSFSFAALVSAVVAIAAAYYFDNRSALTIGVTALAAFIGITITPRAVIDNEIYAIDALSYYGLGLAILLIIWSEYSERFHFKKHFSLVFLTFALHLAGLCSIKGMIENYWYLYIPAIVATVYYFIKKSQQMQAISLYVFAMVYSYIAFNILIYNVTEFISLEDFIGLFFVLLPLYFIGSIVLFINAIKKFNRKNK